MYGPRYDANCGIFSLGTAARFKPKSLCNTTFRFCHKDGLHTGDARPPPTKTFGTRATRQVGPTAWHNAVTKTLSYLGNRALAKPVTSGFTNDNANVFLFYLVVGQTMDCGSTASDGPTVHSLYGTWTNTVHSWITSAEKYVLGGEKIGLQQISLWPQWKWTRDFRGQKSATNYLSYGMALPSHRNISTALLQTTEQYMYTTINLHVVITFSILWLITPSIPLIIRPGPQGQFKYLDMHDIR